MSLYDKILGSVTTLAIGDALGAPHELRGRIPYELFDGTIKHCLRWTNQWQGTREGSLGQVSDDTEMTIILLDHYVSHKHSNATMDRENLILSYMQWGNEGNSLMGVNTRKLFKGVKTMRGYNSRYQKEFSPGIVTPSVTLPFFDGMGNVTSSYTMAHDSNFTQSNGTLMRATGLIPYFINKDDNTLINNDGWNAVIIDTLSTNPNAINLECNVLYLMIYRLLHQNWSLEEIFQWLQNNATQDVVKQAIVDAQQDARDVSGWDKGWAVNSFHVSLWGLWQLTKRDHNTVHCHTILNDIILMRGDADTNAAIGGGLLGFYYGYQRLATVDVWSYNWSKVYYCDTNQGDFPRHSRYHPNRLLTLIHQIFT